MPANLDNTQRDALADVISYLIDLAVKRRQQNLGSAIGDPLQDNPPAAETIIQPVAMKDRRQKGGKLKQQE